MIRLCRRALLALPLLTLARPRPAEAVEGASVTIDNFVFTPAELTVKAGTTVTWTNEDDIPHTVTAKDLAFRSRPLDTGDAFSRPFAVAGRFDYFCSLHPHMVGSVIVVS